MNILNTLIQCTIYGDLKQLKGYLCQKNCQGRLYYIYSVLISYTINYHQWEIFNYLIANGGAKYLCVRHIILHGHLWVLDYLAPYIQMKDIIEYSIIYQDKPVFRILCPRQLMPKGIFL